MANSVIYYWTDGNAKVETYEGEYTIIPRPGYDYTEYSNAEDFDGTDYYAGQKIINKDLTLWEYPGSSSIFDPEEEEGSNESSSIGEKVTLTNKATVYCGDINWGSWNLGGINVGNMLLGSVDYTYVTKIAIPIANEIKSAVLTIEATNNSQGLNPQYCGAVALTSNYSSPALAASNLAAQTGFVYPVDANGDKISAGIANGAKVYYHIKGVQAAAGSTLYIYLYDVSDETRSALDGKDSGGDYAIYYVEQPRYFYKTEQGWKPCSIQQKTASGWKSASLMTKTNEGWQ